MWIIDKNGHFINLENGNKIEFPSGQTNDERTVFYIILVTQSPKNISVLAQTCDQGEHEAVCAQLRSLLRPKPLHPSAQ